jgi:transposase InsO family protein
VKYAFILAELLIYPLSVVCWVLGVTESGLHAWKRRAPSTREQERNRLSADIRRVFDAHGGRYGAPRLYRFMCERSDYTGSLNRIKKLMRAMGLVAKAGKKYKVTTDSAHQLPIAPNFLALRFQLRHACRINITRQSARSGLALRHHLPLDARGLAVRVRGARSVHSQNRRLGHRGAHDATACAGCVANG